MVGCSAPRLLENRNPVFVFAVVMLDSVRVCAPVPPLVHSTRAAAGLAQWGFDGGSYYLGSVGKSRLTCQRVSQGASSARKVWKSPVFQDCFLSGTALGIFILTTLLAGLSFPFCM